MIIYPHWWQDDGTCELDCRDWRGAEAVGYDVDDEIVNRFRTAEAEYRAAKQALYEATQSATPIRWPQKRRS